MKKHFSILKNWFAYAAILTMMCFLVYIVVQQNFRQSANDPQYQLAEDAIKALDNGADPKSFSGVVPAVEIAQSLSPYLIIYDAGGSKAAGSATLNGQPLKIPVVAIDYVNKNGSDALTWQPQPGVRQAMVGLRGKNYLAFAGRSLRKTEERISLLGKQVLLGWVLSLLAMLVVVIIQEVVSKKLAGQAI